MREMNGLSKDTDYGLGLAALAADIRSGCANAAAEMYRVVIPWLKAFLIMRVPADHVDDYAHDIFLSLIRFIECGSIRDEKCLPGIIRTIAFRVVAEHRKSRCTAMVTVDAAALESRVPDSRADLEENLARKQRMEIALKTLDTLAERDREILRRFYLEEQTQEQIIREMGLTETQFRLIKSRAKARFGELGRKTIRRSLTRVA